MKLLLRTKGLEPDRRRSTGSGRGSSIDNLEIVVVVVVVGRGGSRQFEYFKTWYTWWSSCLQFESLRSECLSVG